VVKPALPAIAVAQPAKAATAAQPAPGAGTMVQIAAVSHSEDAEVLMNALRKRGYTVTARHLLGDNLIHVQIGPFANRSDANAMSQKLLSDGYNAVQMP
jgi:cell division septation protein DedD